jgi:hypothetical protein
LSAATGPGSALGGLDEEDEEFGEIEMGETNGHPHAAINAENAKFTVEEDEDHEQM